MTGIRDPMRSRSSSRARTPHIKVVADNRTSFSMLGRIAYFGTLMAIAVSAIPHGTVEPRHKGFLVVSISVLGILRVLDGLLNSDNRVAEWRLIAPMVGVIAIAFIQLLPILGGSPLSLEPYNTRSFILVFAAVIISAEILFYYARSVARLKELVVLVLILAFGSALFGFARDLLYGSQFDIFANYLRSGEQSYAQFIIRNHFALLVEMAVGLLIGLLLKPALGAKTKFAGFLITIVLIYSLFAANSRGGLVSLGGMAVFSVFVYVMTRSRSTNSRVPKSGRQRRTQKYPLLLKIATATGVCVLVLGIFVVLVAFVGGDRVVTRLEKIDTEVGRVDDTHGNRAAIWESTLELIKSRPILGSGFGAYAAAITKFDESSGSFPLEEAHSEYLEILANGGIVAAILFGIFAVLVGVRLIRNMRSEDRFRRACCFGAMIAIFGVVIHSFVDFGLHILVNALVFVVVIVVGAANVGGESEKPASKGRVISFTYLLLLALVAVGGARYAAANYLAQRALESGSVSSADLALTVEPDNPYAHEARGVTLIQTEDFPAAVVSFEKCAELSPYNYGRWVRLAFARSQNGDPGGADAAYARAIELAPEYSRPRMHAGEVFLRRGDPDKAFQYFSAAARHDPFLYREILYHAHVTFGEDADAIERAVAPESKLAKAIVAGDLINNGLMSPNTRAFLTGDELLPVEKDNFARVLIEKKNYFLAREIWLSRMGMAVDSVKDQPLFDPGFEQITASDPSGLGWQIDQKVSATSVARDQKDFHSGTAALNVEFAGNVELQWPIVSQLAFGEPGGRYTLSFFARGGDLISGGLPAVVVTDPATGSLLTRSEPIQDTKGNWVQQTISFTFPSSGVALVSLQRPECKTSPCPIFGELSIDDIIITPQR